MPKYDLSKRIVNGELTRRQMLKGLGAAGVLSTTIPMIPNLKGKDGSSILRPK